ncbi:MAG: hypothetical protein M1826_003987 [Phylliscum demangeonii]|nr:MAG: hypothetical protein M1826_003987 [Phylliscum demangeonii]
MFCLRSWLPLLFIPTNASPVFILLFIVSTYFLHRPCVYCSVLLFILFVSSCHWSDHCFFDVHRNWFEPRHMSSPLIPGYMNATTTAVRATMAAGEDDDGRVAGAAAAATATATTLAYVVAAAARTTAAAWTRAVVGESGRRAAGLQPHEWSSGAGLGLKWIRAGLGRREWTLPYVEVLVRL